MQRRRLPDVGFPAVRCLLLNGSHRRRAMMTDGISSSGEQTYFVVMRHFR